MADQDIDDVQTIENHSGVENTPPKAYPYEEGDFIVLGPGIFSAKDRSVLNWEGVNYVIQKTPIVHAPLSQYTVGEYCEVQKGGYWLHGKVAGIEKGPTLLIYVDTAKGPVTIGSTHYIRKGQTDAD